MWGCECGLRFKNPDIGITCPACGSMNIVEIGDIISDINIGMPEHQNCSCINGPIITPEGIPWIQGWMESTPLSFDDLEINEMCLIDLGLPSGHPTSLEDSVPAITYYSEMNSRFLRTFLGEPVWA